MVDHEMSEKIARITRTIEADWPIKKSIDNQNKKKIVIGLGGSSSGAKALSFFIRDEITYFDNLDFEYLQNFFKRQNIKDYIFCKK